MLSSSLLSSGYHCFLLLFLFFLYVIGPYKAGKGSCGKYDLPTRAGAEQTEEALSIAKSFTIRFHR